MKKGDLNLNKPYMLNVSFLDLKEERFTIKSKKYWLKALNISEIEFGKLIENSYFR
jgi:hypothetical protein